MKVITPLGMLLTSQLSCLRNRLSTNHKIIQPARCHMSDTLGIYYTIYLVMYGHCSVVVAQCAFAMITNSEFHTGFFFPGWGNVDACSGCL